MANQQRIPNLQELDEKEAYSFLSDVFFSGPIPDPEVVYEANHPEDYAMEMPQSGERIVGRESLRRSHKAYPNSPSIRVRRVAGEGRALGCGGDQRLRWSGIRHGNDPRAKRREDMARQALLRRAV